MSIHLIKNVSSKKKLLFIILATTVISLNATQIPSKIEKNTLSNSYFTIGFNNRTGIISIYRANGQPLISGAMCGINSDIEHRISNASNYTYSIKTVSINNDIGMGSMLKIIGHDHKKMLDIEIRISLYDNLHAVVFEMLCKNVSEDEIIINSIEPLRVIKAESGSLFFPDMQKCLTNGAMYYDAARFTFLVHLIKKLNLTGKPREE